MLFVCSRLISELSSLYAHNVPNYGIRWTHERSPLDRTPLHNIFLPVLVLGVETTRASCSRGHGTKRRSGQESAKKAREVAPAEDYDNLGPHWPDDIGDDNIGDVDDDVNVIPMRLMYTQ